MLKKLSLLVVLAGALGIPPLVYNGEHWWEMAKQRVAPLLSLGTGVAEAAAAASAPASLVGTITPAPGSPAPATNSPGQPAQTPAPSAESAADELAAVIRFDVTPGWVMQRWSWVAAGLSQLPLQGYRVPWVTGTAEDDLAGSLTYYFNARQQVERITFQGKTGDAGKLIRFLVARYGFGRRLTNDPGLFRYELPEPGGPAKSHMDARLVQPNDPHERFHVALVLERPEGKP